MQNDIFHRLRRSNWSCGKIAIFHRPSGDRTQAAPASLEFAWQISPRKSRLLPSAGGSCSKAWLLFAANRGQVLTMVWSLTAGLAQACLTRQLRCLAWLGKPCPAFRAAQLSLASLTSLLRKLAWLGWQGFKGELLRSWQIYLAQISSWDELESAQLLLFFDALPPWCPLRGSFLYKPPGWLMAISVSTRPILTLINLRGNWAWFGMKS